MATSSRNIPRREASKRGSEAISKHIQSSSVDSDDDAIDEEVSAPAEDTSLHAGVMSDLTRTTPTRIQPEFRVPPLPTLSPVRRPPVTRTYGHRSRSHSMSGSRLSVSPHKSASTSKGREPQPPTPESSLSPLPPELEYSPRKRTNKADVPTTPKKRQRMVQEASPSSHSRRGRQSSRTTLSLSRTDLSLQPSPKMATHNTSVDDSWSIDKLKGFVWVLVDGNWRLVDRSDHSCETYWWPAEVLDVDDCMPTIKLALFNCPKPEHELVVKSPSRHNILPYLTNMNQQRFVAHNFIVRSDPSVVAHETPPGLLTCWTEALLQLQAEFKLTHDGLVSSLTHMMEEAKKPQKNGDPKRSPLKRKQERSPSPVDLSLEIPGELVLARTKKSRKPLYWPARILAFVEGGLYRVEFMDAEVHELSRHMFFTMDQDEFGTCEKGEYTSELSAVEVDSEDRDDIWQQIIKNHRYESIEPEEPPPESNEFQLLPIDKQFAYTKSVLQHVLLAEYLPIKSLHDAFMSGGHKRANLAKGAVYSGELTSEETEQLAAYVRRWALRQDALGTKSRNDVGTPNNRSDNEHVTSTLCASYSAVTSSDAAECKQKVCEQTPFTGTAFEEETERASSPVTTPPSSFVTDPFDDRSTPCPSASDVKASSTSVKAATNENAQMGHSDTFDRQIPINHTDDVSTRRPKGCPSYEGLSIADQQEYCDNVLLPEAILQIHLWRMGSRKVLGVLPPEEEQRLHDLGEETVRSHYWVLAIERMRLLKEGNKAKPAVSSVDNQSSRSVRSTARSRRLL